MAGTALDDIAVELCAGPLGTFTRRRDERAEQATDPILARGIRNLRKPSVAAWIVDLLVRREPEAVDEALDLGAALREAQEDLDAATLAELTKQRRALVAGLARRGVALAAEQPISVSRAATDDIEKTLNAAMRDAAAADAVRTGRLVRALDVVGFDPVDLDGALAGSLTAPAPATRPTRDDLAELRARKAAERAAREAAQTAGVAERELTSAETALGKARERAEHVHERIAGLRAELERFEADAERLSAAVTAAESVRDELRDHARVTRRAADAAARALDP